MSKRYDVSSFKIKDITNYAKIFRKGDFEHFMLKEIFEQPASIKASFRGRINEDKVKLGGIFDWTQEILSKKYNIIKIKVDEISKLDAGLSCMSLRW